jgi:hypothetical protein
LVCSSGGSMSDRNQRKRKNNKPTTCPGGLPINEAKS